MSDLTKKECPVCNQTGHLYIHKDGTIRCRYRVEVHSEAYGVHKEWEYCWHRERP